MRMIAQLLPFLVWPLHQKREGSSCWRCSDRECCLLLGRTSAAEEAVCGPSLSWPEQVHARNTFHPPWRDLRCPSCANTLNRKQVSRFSNAKIARKKQSNFSFWNCCHVLLLCLVWPQECRHYLNPWRVAGAVHLLYQWHSSSWPEKAAGLD